MLYGAELQCAGGLASAPMAWRPRPLSARVLVEPALRRETQKQRDGENAHAGVEEPWLGGRVSIPPDEDADPRHDHSRDEQTRHSGRLRRSVNRRTPFLKSSVDRASTFVTTPAAIPSSNESESSL